MNCRRFPRGTNSDMILRLSRVETLQDKDVQDSTIVAWSFGQSKEEDNVWVSAFSHDPPFPFEVFVHLACQHIPRETLTSY